MGGEQTDEDAVRELHDGIHAALGARLREMWLFGSRARGDYNPDSDFDILVVADGNRAELREVVAAAEDDILLKRGQVFASVVYTTEEWKWARNAPLGVNVRREGKRIA
ncbi:MAG TPA: nucleotidyltransferase domain-containing protein [Spirochaetia bacterium]|nr:nucleotidyltransferase domain-containing protein [Spirochaetia bacterium]